MLMGFIGFGSTPPAPPSSEDEPPPDRRPDDTGIRISPGARTIASLYGRKTSKVGRYAWAISLGVHLVVLVGAFFVMRYYLRPARPKVPADVDDQRGTGSIIQSQGVSDLLRGAPGLRFATQDSAPDQALLSRENLPSFVRREPQITKTLSDLSPSSGVEGFNPGAEKILGRLPVHSKSAGQTAARPDRTSPR